MIDTKQFATSLYREYLEELGFLSHQRRYLLREGASGWLAYDHSESRLEAHLDGLMIGGPAALGFCEEQAKSADAEALDGALRVFCRSGRPDAAEVALAKVGPDDEEACAAAADALRHEWPAGWGPEIVATMLPIGKLGGVAASLIGFRRMTDCGRLLASPRATDDPALAPVLWAMGRLGNPTLLPWLRGHLDNPDARIRGAAAFASLRVGDAQALEVCRRAALEGEAWPLLPLAVAGGPQHFESLLRGASGTEPCREAVLALGLFGDPAGAGVLMAALADESVAAIAAQALELMTGAGLNEQIFVPEKIVEDELTPEELELVRAGKPLYPPGEERGANVTRTCQDARTWERWLDSHRGSFPAGQRVRRGVPVSPASLVDALTSESSGGLARQWSIDELTIRYGATVPLEADHFAKSQRAMLRELKTWAGTIAGRFAPGAFVFANQQLGPGRSECGV